MFAGQYHVVSGSNGFISWASAPISVDLHDTYLDSGHNAAGNGNRHSIEIREKAPRDILSFHTKTGNVISGLLFNDVENSQTISFSNPLINT